MLPLSLTYLRYLLIFYRHSNHYQYYGFIITVAREAVKGERITKLRAEKLFKDYCASEQSRKLNSCHADANLVIDRLKNIMALEAVTNMRAELTNQIEQQSVHVAKLEIYFHVVVLC